MTNDKRIYVLCVTSFDPVTKEITSWDEHRTKPMTQHDFSKTRAKVLAKYGESCCWHVKKGRH